MERIAKFHKVSKERFVADWMDAFYFFKQKTAYEIDK